MRLLVAGIGNVLFGDDGFGPAVVAELAERPLPAGVRVMDAGVRGFDLTSALLDGYDGAILIDAAMRGGAPGTLYVLEPELSEPPDEYGLDLQLDAHRLEPSRVLQLAHATGARLSSIRVVACEPQLADEMSNELSPAVRAAVEPAARIVERLIREMRGEEGVHA
jgi:hydrogenase maturation protease